MTRQILAAAAVVAFALTAGTSAQQKAAQQKAAPAKGAPSKAAAPAAGGVPPRGAIPNNPIPMSEASVKAGRVVFAKACRACHGLQGRGDGTTAPPGSKPANLVDAYWKYGGTDGEIFLTVKHGVKPFDVMEPWGKKISDTDIWHTVNLLRDFAKPKAAKK